MTDNAELPEDIMDRARAVFEACAKDRDIPPYLVTRGMLRDYSNSKGGVLPERTLFKLGGFLGLKHKLYPLEENPLATKEVRAMSVVHAKQIIVRLIGLASDEMNRTPHELSFYEFARYIGLRYGHNNAGVAKDTITRCGGYNVIRDSHYGPRATQDTVDKSRMRHHARMNRKLGEQYNDVQFFIDRLFEDYAEKVFKGRIEPPPARKVKFVGHHLLMLSDLHIGSDIKKEETGLADFGNVEESRRLASLVRQTAHMTGETLTILLLGDILENILHDPHDGAALSEQFARAVHLLAQVISQMSPRYAKVKVISVPGNHDRITSRHKKRAVKHKWDSFATMITICLRALLSQHTNVQFHIPKTPFFSFEINGKRIFATHGDTVLAPGQTVFVMDSAIRKLFRVGGSKSIYVMGHIHLGHFIALPSGATLVVNPALVPSNDFAVSCGNFDSRCGQFLLDIRPDIVVPYLLEVGLDTDADASLDKIVKPWENFDS